MIGLHKQPDLFAYFLKENSIQISVYSTSYIHTVGGDSRIARAVECNEFAQAFGEFRPSTAGRFVNRPYGIAIKMCAKLQFIVHDCRALGHNKAKGGVNMKKEEEEKKTVSWEVADPKPPIVQSGHLEGRKQNLEG